MASRSTRARVTKKTPTKTPAPSVKEEVEPKVVVEEAKAEATTNGDKKEEVKAEEVTGEVKTEEEMEGEEAEGEEAEGEEAEGEELGEEELDEEAETKLLEGEEETEEKEVKEGEETEAKEGEKTEEKKEQTEEEKKAAEEAKKVKAAAEKKQADEKRKTYIPSAGKYSQDEHVYMRLRSVVVGPLELEDLQKELVQDMANKSEEFFYRFHFIEKEEKHVGHIEFRFKSITEADKMIETLKTIKEGVVVKRLVGGMNAAKFDKDVRGINDESEKEKYKRIVAVGGVPESATMEKLQEVFPDARVKFIALKPDGTPKWYAYLELADEEAAKTFADSHKEVEFEGEKLYCRSLRPGKPEDADIDPDHVMSEEERRKLQARINTMKYKLNGGAVLRPLDAQRLRRRVSQLQSLLRANQKRGKGGAGDQPEGTPPAAANKTPNKTPQAGNNQAGNRRGGRGGGMRGGMRGGRGGNQGGVMRGGRFGPGGPNRNMGGPGFHGNNMQQQQGMQNPIVSPGRQQGFYGAGRGRGAGNQGPVQQQQPQQGGGRQSGNNMYNNPRRTANAVDMLVGLTNLLSQARNQGGSQGTQRGSGTQGNMRNQNQGNMNNQGGNFGGNGGGNGGFNNDSASYGGGNYNNQGSDFNSGSGFGGGNQGFNSNNQGGGGGGGFNNQGGNYGGNQGGGNFNNQGGNRKRPFTGGQGQGQGQQGQTQGQGKNKQRRRNSQGRGRF